MFNSVTRLVYSLLILTTINNNNNTVVTESQTVYSHNQLTITNIPVNCSRGIFPPSASLNSFPVPPTP